MSARPNLTTEQDAAAKEAAYRNQERWPKDVTDAIDILSSAGIGTREGLTAYLDGKPESALNLPSFDLVKRPNQGMAYNLVVSSRAVLPPEKVKEPAYSLPNPDDPALRMPDLTKHGAVFVAQFAKKYPEQYARLQRQEDRRLATPGGGSLRS